VTVRVYLLRDSTINILSELIPDDTDVAEISHDEFQAKKRRIE